MAVNDGQPVNAEVTNAAYISRTQDSDTTGKVGLKNTDVESGNEIENAQRLINELAEVQGNAGEGDATSKDYSSNNVVTNGDDRKVAIGKLDAEFDASTGHDHDGVNSKAINAASLEGFNPFTAEYQGLDVASIDGTSIDVTTEFSGKVAGGDSTTEGVLTDAPNNYVSIIITSDGTEVTDPDTGQRVYARVTEAAGVWTLSFFINNFGNPDTPYDTTTHFSGTPISIFYREVFGPTNPKPTITADVGGFDSLNATQDIPDATPVFRGLVNDAAQQFGGQKTFVTGLDVNGDPVVTEAASQTIDAKTITNASIEDPIRSDVKKDTQANLETYALTASNGQKVFATDTKTYYSILDNALVPEGSGEGGSGVGSLDVYFVEDFESYADTTALENAYTLTGAGSIALDETNNLSGSKSLVYTQAIGSLGDTIESPLISLSDKQNNLNSKISFYAEYTGSNDEIAFKVGGQQQGLIKSGQNLYEASFSTSGANTSIEIEVLVENDGAILRLDDIQLTTDSQLQLTTFETETYYADTLAGLASTNTFIPYYTNVNEDSSGGIVDIQNDPALGFSITAIKPCTVSVVAICDYGGTGERLGLTLNGTDNSQFLGLISNPQEIIETTSNSNQEAISSTVRLKTGDVLRLHSGNGYRNGYNP
jgi:hypothetical protein